MSSNFWPNLRISHRSTTYIANIFWKPIDLTYTSDAVGFHSNCLPSGLLWAEWHQPWARWGPSRSRQDHPWLYCSQKTSPLFNKNLCLFTHTNWQYSCTVLVRSSQVLSIFTISCKHNFRINRRQRLVSIFLSVPCFLLIRTDRPLTWQWTQWPHGSGWTVLHQHTLQQAAR